MNKQKWYTLFEDSTLESTLSLLTDPAQLIKRLDHLSQLLQAYINSHRLNPPAWEWWEVEFTEALRLLTFLDDIRTWAMYPERYNLVRPVESAGTELTAHFESFWCEGWCYKQPLQNLSEQIWARQRVEAAKKDRKRKLPKGAELLAVYNEYVAGPGGPSSAAGKVAKRYEATSRAVLKAVKKALDEQKNGT